ncbi:hypothetical protein EJ02DRAFT_477615 [Clathrospora elynae]|uniref:Uncharacterized protein n=1 Tax=Clathrospora elynae TaxID=706981 RepID=A0A6A5SB62_9PLEO|nr:hypothetical protein EJ02DRAFT_477615 [Clathrospora elynae]
MAAVKDPSSKEAKELSTAFHSLQTQNQKEAQEEEVYPGAGRAKREHWWCNVFTLSKVKEAQFIKRIKQQDREAKILGKAEDRQRKAEATALKQKEKEQAKVAREEAKKVRDTEKAVKATVRARKRYEAEAAKAQKAANLSKKGTAIVQQKSRPKPKPKRSASQLQGGGDRGEGQSQPPQKASRTQTIRAPERYSE